MKTYKYKLRLNKQQQYTIDRWINTCRWIYNTALEVKETAWKSRRQNITRFELSRQFTECKKNVYDEQSRLLSETLAFLPRTIVTHTLIRLDLAFQAFFKKNNSNTGYPKYKNKDTFNSIGFQEVKRGINGFVLPVIGELKHYKDRWPEGELRNAEIIRETSGYYLCVTFIDTPKIKEPVNPDIVGVDMGVAKLATISTGQYYNNPKVFKQYEKKLAKLQRSLARKKKNSNRYNQVKREINLLHSKISRTRNDYQHKVTTKLVSYYAGFVVEDLKLKNMTKSAKGTTEKPGKNVKAKSGLNKSILDSAPGMFLIKLKYKAEDQQRLYSIVNPAHTSQTCPECGHVDKANRVTQSKFECVSCGYSGNADHIAAINILRRGTAGGR